MVVYIFLKFIVCVYVYSTIFIGAYDNGVRDRTIPHGSSGQDPDTIVGPFPELVHCKFPCIGVIDCDLDSFRVGQGIVHKEYFVVNDISVLLVLWRWSPGDTNGRRVLGLTLELLRWCSGCCVCQVQCFWFWNFIGSCENGYC